VGRFFVSADEMRRKDRPAEPEFGFKYYAHRYVEKAKRQAERGERNANYIRTATVALDNDDWGLVRHFATRDVRELKTRDWQLFIEKIAVDVVPDTPRVTVRDNPRPFFRFHPLVTQANDEYKKLLAGAKSLAANGTVVRGVPVTEELYDLILFTVHSFVRPVTTELYALKHNDITIADDPKRLLVTVRNGKTGMRISNTIRDQYAQARAGASWGFR
jgi:hypothetical protein